MTTTLLSSIILLSILHGAIPGHWVPVMALKKQYHWQNLYAFKVISLLNLSHVISTVFIGILLSLFSNYISVYFTNELTIKIFSSVVLIILGIFFIYKHQHHHHFQLFHENKIMQQKSIQKQIYVLTIGMLFSPCMEITGLYFVSGLLNWKYAVIISLIYLFVSFLSSLFWFFLFDKLSAIFNLHKIEHYSGLLSGFSLIVSAIILLFV